MQDLILLINVFFESLCWFLIGLLVVGLILEFGHFLLIRYEYRMKQKSDAKQQTSDDLDEVTHDEK